MSEKRLEEFLLGYAAVGRTIGLRPAEIGACDLYPDSMDRALSFDIIKQLCVYANRIYLHDPIAELVRKWHRLPVDLPSAFLHRTDAQKRSAFREELGANLASFWKLEPLATANILQLVPTALLENEPPGAFYAHDLYGPDPSVTPIHDVPAAVMEYADRHLLTKMAIVRDGVPLVLRTDRLEPCNMIAVFFPGDPYPGIYHLFSIESVDESERMVFGITYEEGRKDVDPDTFRNWVNGSRRNFLHDRLQALTRDVSLAAATRSRFVTGVSSSRDLVQLDPTPGVGEGRDEGIVKALMSFQLPYLQNASFDQLVKARENEAEFEQFRSAMDKAFRELSGKGEPNLQRVVEQVSQDLLRAPIARIDQKMRSLRGNLFLDSALLVGTLASTIISGGNSLLWAATVAVASKAINTYKDQKKEKQGVHEIPSFFYWNAT